MASNTSVYGIFRDRFHAENGIDRLRASGFMAEDISLLLPDNISNKDLKVEGNSKAPEGAVTGGAVGALNANSNNLRRLASCGGTFVYVRSIFRRTAAPPLSPKCKDCLQRQTITTLPRRTIDSAVVP